MVALPLVIAADVGPYRTIAAIGDVAADLVACAVVKIAGGAVVDAEIEAPGIIAAAGDADLPLVVVALVFCFPADGIFAHLDVIRAVGRVGDAIVRAVARTVGIGVAILPEARRHQGDIRADLVTDPSREAIAPVFVLLRLAVADRRVELAGIFGGRATLPVTRSGQAEIQRAALAEQRGAAARFAVRAAFGFGIGLEPVLGGAPGDDVDHPADRFRTVQRALIATQHFDPGDVGRSQVIGRKLGAGGTGIAKLDAVDQPKHLVIGGAANAEAGGVAVAGPIGVQVDARYVEQRLRDEAGLVRFQIVRGQDRDGTADLPRLAGYARSRNNDFVILIRIVLGSCGHGGGQQPQRRASLQRRTKRVF